MQTAWNIKTQDEELNRQRAAALELYKSFPRFSTEKHKMYEMWSKDKSCRWINSYEQSITHKVEKQDETLKGHGTKCPKRESPR